jgi:hypothetical protein
VKRAEPVRGEQIKPIEEAAEPALPHGLLLSAPSQIPLELQTVYSELVEHLRSIEFMRSFSSLSGAFLLRSRESADYWYFRTSEGPSSAQEFYLGPDNREIRALIESHKQGREGLEAAEARVTRLAAMLRGGGIELTDKASMKIINGLAAAGVFRMGGVLIGTHAFLAEGNAIGVRWPSAMRTQDVDFGTPRHLDLALPQTPQTTADIPSALEELRMGFLPQVRLHNQNKPTSFVVHGQEWRVDILTWPKGRDRSTPVHIPRLNAYAEPLEFMDYLLEKTLDAALVGPSGATLVRIPEPARFALHKLLVASNRTAQFQPKAAKDRLQAFHLLTFLQQERPGDIQLAAEALLERGKSWRARLRREIEKLPAEIPELAEALP